MLRDWHHLLEAEARQAAGEPMAPLQSMHFRHAVVPKLAYMANETNKHELFNIMRCLTTHVGDTALIEMFTKKRKILGSMSSSTTANAFKASKCCTVFLSQVSRDSLRDSRHFQKSRTGK